MLLPRTPRLGEQVTVPPGIHYIPHYFETRFLWCCQDNLVYVEQTEMTEMILQLSMVEEDDHFLFLNFADYLRIHYNVKTEWKMNLLVNLIQV